MNDSTSPESAGPLNGKVALVTGGAKGIGRAITQALAARGAQVIITSRSLATSNASAGELGRTVKVHACNLRDAHSIEALFTQIKKEFGGLDILVNNAGVAGPTSEVADFSLDIWNEVIETNLTGTFLVTREALPLLRNGGTIVFNLSIMARTVFAGMAAYAASKHGLLGFANTLREELRPRAVRVLSLLPGATDTDIWQQFWPEAPRKKMMSPESVAEAVVAAVLLPPEASVSEIVIAPTAGNL